MISSETSSHPLSLYQEKWPMLNLSPRLFEIAELVSTQISTIHNRASVKEAFCSHATPRLFLVHNLLLSTLLVHELVI